MEKNFCFSTGGMGTLLQERGLAPGELPETWNMTRPEVITEIHRAYIEAGSDIILTNTFGANALKFHDSDYQLEEIIEGAVSHVREAVQAAGVSRPVYTALDVGTYRKASETDG